MIISFIILLTVLTLFILWRFFYFFRNPKRESISSENEILSPADGYILYIKHIDDTDQEIFSIKKGQKIFLRDLMMLRKTEIDLHSGWLIGILMTPVDVHFNRAPVNGYIEKLCHDFPSPLGKNFNMFPSLQNMFFKKEEPYSDATYLVHNERASYMISNSIINIYITQIADKYIKKIVTFKDKTEINKGEVFGLIRMGSQVDIFIPDTRVNIIVTVREHQHLMAGVDIIAKLG
jgi:phosphatidylserine decarboxylase